MSTDKVSRHFAGRGAVQGAVPGLTLQGLDADGVTDVRFGDDFLLANTLLLLDDLSVKRG